MTSFLSCNYHPLFLQSQTSGKSYVHVCILSSPIHHLSPTHSNLISTSTTSMKLLSPNATKGKSALILQRRHSQQHSSDRRPDTPLTSDITFLGQAFLLLLHCSFLDSPSSKCRNPLNLIPGL